MGAAYLIMTPFDVTFSKPLPPIILFLSGLFQFIYMTLDAVDGKQARKLGVSSPLGMLLDHGCDSFSVTFLMLCTMQSINMGLSIFSLGILAASLTSFYIATWEEYHTHMCRTHIMGWGVT